MTTKRKGLHAGHATRARQARQLEAKIAALTESDWTTQEIADALGIHRKSVSRARRRLGLTVAGRREAAERKAAQAIIDGFIYRIERRD